MRLVEGRSTIVAPAHKKQTIIQPDVSAKYYSSKYRKTMDSICNRHQITCAMVERHQIEQQRRRRASIMVILAFTVAASFLFATTTINKKRHLHSSLLRSNNPIINNNFDAEFESSRNQRNLISLIEYEDPKSVSLRPDILEASSQMSNSIYLQSDGGNNNNNNNAPAVEYDEESRANCQIIFAIGVEGSIHHGFTPIINTLASTQNYIIPGPESRQKQAFRRAIYSAQGTPKPEDVIQTMNAICPKDGKKRVYIDGKSWPCGLKNRDKAWQDMTPLEISMSFMALNEPTNLYDLVNAYSPYADIKFIVLHRPYLEVIASHKKWDGGPMKHSNVIRGHMLLLKEFLDRHVLNHLGQRMWTVLCTEKIMAKNYDDSDEGKEQVARARNEVITQLANFLGWPTNACPNCFDEWHESTKDAQKVLGGTIVDLLQDHIKSLVGVWPPVDDTLPLELSQCHI